MHIMCENSFGALKPIMYIDLSRTNYIHVKYPCYLQIGIVQVLRTNIYMGEGSSQLEANDDTGLPLESLDAWVASTTGSWCVVVRWGYDGACRHYFLAGPCLQAEHRPSGRSSLHCESTYYTGNPSRNASWMPLMYLINV